MLPSAPVCPPLQNAPQAHLREGEEGSIAPIQEGAADHLQDEGDVLEGENGDGGTDSEAQAQQRCQGQRGYHGAQDRCGDRGPWAEGEERLPGGKHTGKGRSRHLPKSPGRNLKITLESTSSHTPVSNPSINIGNAPQYHQSNGPTPLRPCPLVSLWATTNLVAPMTIASKGPSAPAPQPIA